MYDNRVSVGYSKSGGTTFQDEEKRFKRARFRESWSHEYHDELREALCAALVIAKHWSNMCKAMQKEDAKIRDYFKKCVMKREE